MTVPVQRPTAGWGDENRAGVSRAMKAPGSMVNTIPSSIRLVFHGWRRRLVHVTEPDAVADLPHLLEGSTYVDCNSVGHRRHYVRISFDLAGSYWGG